MYDVDCASDHRPVVAVLPGVETRLVHFEKKRNHRGWKPRSEEEASQINDWFRDQDADMWQCGEWQDALAKCMQLYGRDASREEELEELDRFDTALLALGRRIRRAPTAEEKLRLARAEARVRRRATRNRKRRRGPPGPPRNACFPSALWDAQGYAEQDQSKWPAIVSKFWEDKYHDEQFGTAEQEKCLQKWGGGVQCSSD